MIYRYRIEHRVPPGLYSRLVLRDAVKRFGDLGCRPMQDGFTHGFVVGCGHSGTTLLASRLGRHDRVFLVSKESGAFSPEWWLRATCRFWDDIHARALAAGASHIVEKTPIHVYCRKRIRKLFPDAKIFGIMRNPFDTCASLAKRFGDLDYAIERWVLSNTALAEGVDAGEVIPVRFETLVGDPVGVLEQQLAQMALGWQESVVEGSTSSYEHTTDRTPNQALRYAQISDSITDRTGESGAALSQADRNRIRHRTAALAERLGYAEALAFPARPSMTPG